MGDCWFPEKAMLLVQADVIERATGNRESVVDRSCQFISSPYHIDFKNTPKYFKPGLPFVVKVCSYDDFWLVNKKAVRRGGLIVSVLKSGRSLCRGAPPCVLGQNTSSASLYLV